MFHYSCSYPSTQSQILVFNFHFKKKVRALSQALAALAACYETVFLNTVLAERNVLCTSAAPLQAEVWASELRLQEVRRTPGPNTACWRCCLAFVWLWWRSSALFLLPWSVRENGGRLQLGFASWLTLWGYLYKSERGEKSQPKPFFLVCPMPHVCSSEGMKTIK